MACTGVPCPSAAGHLKCFPRKLFGSHLGDGEMRNIGQFLGTAKRCLTIQQVMEVLHLYGRVRHANEDSGRHRNEGLHFPQTDFEGLDLAADFLQFQDGLTLRSLQQAGRKDGEVSRQMWQFRMQFPTEFLDELPDRFSYVGHQGITRTRHDRREIIPRRGAYARESSALPRLGAIRAPLARHPPLPLRLMTESDRPEDLCAPAMR